MRILVALELTRGDDSARLDLNELSELVEEEMPRSFESGDCDYQAEVVGIGATVDDLQESMKRRRSNKRAFLRSAKEIAKGS